MAPCVRPPEGVNHHGPLSYMPNKGATQVPATMMTSMPTKLSEIPPITTVRRTKKSMTTTIGTDMRRQGVRHAEQRGWN